MSGFLGQGPEWWDRGIVASGGGPLPYVDLRSGSTSIPYGYRVESPVSYAQIADLYRRVKRLEKLLSCQSEKERQLIAAILAEPGDLVRRGAYADWLEEEGRHIESDNLRRGYF